jgi:hypothetical protein
LIYLYLCKIYYLFILKLILDTNILKLRWGLDLLIGQHIATNRMVQWCEILNFCDLFIACISSRKITKKKVKQGEEEGEKNETFEARGSWGRRRRAATFHFFIFFLSFIWRNNFLFILVIYYLVVQNIIIYEGSQL